MINEITQADITTTISHADLCQILLYGDPSFDDEKNSLILQATIKFIKSSKRFKTLEAYVTGNNTDT